MRICLIHPNYHSGGAEIAGNWLPSVAAAGEMRFFAARHRTATAFHAMVDDEAGKAEADKTVVTLTDGIVKAYKAK